MDRRQPAADQVFILRFWREAADCGQDPGWRAQVKHINTRQLQTAAGTDTAFGLVAAALAAADVGAEPDAAAPQAKREP